MAPKVLEFERRLFVNQMLSASLRVSSVLIVPWHLLKETGGVRHIWIFER
jgi:hypothetical protein